MPANLNRKELRDYYAGEAINGLVAGTQDRLTKNATELARRAFDIADAMVAESDRAVPVLEHTSGIGGGHV